MRDFRGGAHGRVWLACSSSGRVCVIKFSKSNSEASLTHEADVWNTVWRIPARLHKISDRPALVMPYVLPCTPEHAHNDDVKKAVMSAIHEMATAGFQHEDLG